MYTFVDYTKKYFFLNFCVALFLLKNRGTAVAFF